MKLLPLVQEDIFKDPMELLHKLIPEEIKIQSIDLGKNRIIKNIDITFFDIMELQYNNDKEFILKFRINSPAISIIKGKEVPTHIVRDNVTNVYNMDAYNAVLKHLYGRYIRTIFPDVYAVMAEISAKDINSRTFTWISEGKLRTN